MDTLAIERACERLVLDSVYFTDSQNYVAFIRLFAANGTIRRPSGEPLAGREAILNSYLSRPAGRMTRHICTNIRITVESADHARGLSYAVVYSANVDDPVEGHFGVKADPRHMVGEFEDEFVVTPEGWRFASRRARFVMHT